MPKNNKIFKLDEVTKRIKEISFLPPKKNEIVPNQLISMPELDDSFLDIQLPFIKITHGGFPQKGNSLYETFLQRANAISVPIQHGDQIYNFLSAVQNEIESKIEELIPEDKKKTEIDFLDIIREYENQKKSTTEYSFRTRLNLKIIDQKKEDYKILTSIYKKEDKSEFEINTVEDVEKIIRYGSEVQFIIRLNKMYINTKNEGTKKDPKYKMGVTFKILSAQVKDSQNNNNINYKTNYVFSNDDDDEEITTAPTINTDNLDDFED